MELSSLHQPCTEGHLSKFLQTFTTPRSLFLLSTESDPNQQIKEKMTKKTQLNHV